MTSVTLLSVSKKPCMLSVVMMSVVMMSVVMMSVVAPSPLVNIAATHSVVLDTFVKRCEGEVGPLKYSNDPVYNLFKRLSDLQRGGEAINLLFFR
jgi:hypothetical protein